MDYEKKYKEALERAKQFSEKPYIEDSAGIVEYIFPELKESEDERIRKELIDFVKSRLVGFPECDRFITWLEKQGDNTYSWEPTEEQYEALDYAYNSCPDTERGNYYEGVLETLIEDLHKLSEKQGEKPQGKTALEAIKEEKVDNQNCIKPADKEKPKFHEGDWIISNDNKSIYQVIEVKRGIYIIRDNVDNHEYHIGIEECEKSGRLWNISDASEGDVLYCKSHGIKFIMILKCKNKNRSLDSYCRYNTIDGFGIDVPRVMTINDNPKPATKEQRDALMKAMADAGWEFDFEKKELKKIEQPELTEFEDAVKDMMDAYRDAIGDRDATTEEVKKHAAYMLSLIPHKPAEWSEEDMSKVQRICKYLNESKKYYADITEVRECMDWLKSLKDRVQTLAKMEKGIK